ncbi:deformned root hairs 4 [Anopheles sinensis]|uniref:Deformned root hairs 4 n=1 Tax=Anopheles sinensis TaxID=74873 RepID=A0A084VML5_ANOSI|nr:deformned root hairs 4 [Anopheles sinensis]
MWPEVSNSTSFTTPSRDRSDPVAPKSYENREFDDVSANEGSPGERAHTAKAKGGWPMNVWRMKRYEHHTVRSKTATSMKGMTREHLCVYL